MFRSAYLRDSFPRQALLASLLLHVTFGTYLVSGPSLPDWRQDAVPEKFSRSNQKIVWYTPTDTLPPVVPLEEKPPAEEPAEEKVERKLEEKAEKKLEKQAAPPINKQSPAIYFHPTQEIVSKPPAPDNRRQTIIQPKTPEIQLRAEIRLPNMVYWKPEVVPPAPSVTEMQRQLSQIGLPNLPVPQVAAPPPPEPPKLAALNLRVPEIQIASTAMLPLPELPVAPGAPPAAPLEAKKMPELPVPPVLSPEASPSTLQNLIAVSVAPAPPPPIEIHIPAGNRFGAFAVSPEGSPEPEISAGDAWDEAVAISPPVLDGSEMAAIRAPHLSISSVSGGNPLDFPPLVVQAVPEPRRSPLARRPAQQDLTTLLAKATRPSFLPEMSRGQQVVAAPKFFGAKRVHTVTINMPNLTSGSGSWVLRFAELNGNGTWHEEDEGDLSAPVALRKVDPKYAPSAVRDRVEGTVLLAAHILRDGTVSNIEILNTLDPRLDGSAMDALNRWEFQPATKNGIPIDLEVLIQIPFRLPVF
ncbi:MAG: energy transducer TonB [Acidobacteriota bacterium]